jgi:hypothetical protein
METLVAMKAKRNETITLGLITLAYIIMMSPLLDQSFSQPGAQNVRLYSTIGVIIVFVVYIADYAYGKVTVSRRKNETSRVKKSKSRK